MQGLHKRSFGIIMLLLALVAFTPGLSIVAGVLRLVDAVVVILSATLVFIPIPLSNVIPALAIGLISLAYIEEDGLLLSIALLAATIVLMLVTAAAWEMLAGHRSLVMNCVGGRRHRVDRCNPLTVKVAPLVWAAIRRNAIYAVSFLPQAFRYDIGGAFRFLMHIGVISKITECDRCDAGLPYSRLRRNRRSRSMRPHSLHRYWMRSLPPSSGSIFSSFIV